MAGRRSIHLLAVSDGQNSTEDEKIGTTDTKSDRSDRYRFANIQGYLENRRIKIKPPLTARGGRPSTRNSDDLVIGKSIIHKMENTMEKLGLYENLSDAISEDLSELAMLDEDPEQKLKLLATLAERYITAVDFYNRELLFFIDLGIALDNDLWEFHEMLSEANHPAWKMFYSATIQPRYLVKTLLADHLEHSQRRLLAP